MGNLTILWLGDDGGISLHRANACERLGHKVTLINPRKILAKSTWISRVAWHCGGDVFAAKVRKTLLAAIGHLRFDLCIIDQGELIAPLTVVEIKKRCGKVICYNADDPFGGRDGRRFSLYLKCLPYFDLAVVMRPFNVSEAYARGAKRVMHVYQSADEVVHCPVPMSEPDVQKWESEVLFIGTWMPERGPFMSRLISRGVPLSIYGGRWGRSAEWKVIRPYWKGSSIFGTEYAKAVQCAKVNLGLLSKGNRDEWTTRSAEIPSLGGLLCAERTPTHEKFYNDNSEAVFWENADDCADKCFELIADDNRRKLIAETGRVRFLKNNIRNEVIMDMIINEASNCV